MQLILQKVKLLKIEIRYIVDRTQAAITYEK